MTEYEKQKKEENTKIPVANIPKTTPSQTKNILRFTF
jgi:hypothetical protein